MGLGPGVRTPLRAHDVISTKLTWTRDVVRIINKRCASCHHEGGKAPMSLLHYEEARPWAKAIKEEVLERRMPPWGAVKGFGEFLNDRGLTQEEISIFSDWVEGGAPEGEPKFAPEIPTKFEEPSVPKGRFQEVPVQGRTALSKDEVVVGIRPAAGVGKGRTVRVMARRPDGSIEALIWLKDYQPEWKLSYWFATPLTLAKGSEILISPGGSSSVVLLVGKPGRTGP